MIEIELQMRILNAGGICHLSFFCSVLFDSGAFHAYTFLRLFPIIPNRSLEPYQILLDGRVEVLLRSNDRFGF